jgi:hypothetical protein
MIGRPRPVLRLLLAAALLYGSGAQWLLVQGGAWAGMLAARAGRGPIARALSTTFDGAHPCRVCRLVKRGAAADATPRAVVSSRSVDFAFVAVPLIVQGVEGAALGADAPPFVPNDHPEPPAPPPNVLLAA